ncbi:GH92 family glycosyl hydrolase [Phyllobacterium sp. YR531]|uniref:GH92 family glycosyl hydrolase n=1 Tax=Phyllobacterium sp. YR531 TaxID=1144343 RepID=UPI00026F52BE|nr:GH92 family glycosyl hydrolase [Phyllobacterium sp. YR531]EJM99971.1 alpha-1,2-mannosidase, putative [Phyllobacterium sp. YR531]
MFFKRTFVAVLLGTTMLAGCKGDSDNKPADTSSKADAATVAEISQGTFTALNTESDNSRGTNKQFQERINELKSVADADIAALQGLQTRLTKLDETISELEATSLSTEELAKVRGLEEQLKSLKDDFAKSLAANAEFTSLDKLNEQVARLENGKIGAVEFSATHKAVDAKLTALEAAAKTGELSVADIKDRLTKLEADLKTLLPEVREDIAGLTKFVNPFIGTTLAEVAEKNPHSGNVNPGAQTPFGMVSFGPDTRGSNNAYGYGSGGYHYPDKAIKNFSMTHLNGPGCRGQGAVAMMPTDDLTSFVLTGANYSHANETAEPGFYKVAFDNNIVSELTATTRTGMARFSWPDATKAVLVIDSKQSNNFRVPAGGDNGSTIALSADHKSVSGKSVVAAFCDGTWLKPVYFYATFDKPLHAATSSESKGAARLHFDLQDTEKSVQVKIGISSVSVENAKLNLEAENKNLSFEALKAQASAEWNKRLNTIQVDLAKPDELAKVSAAQLPAAKTHLTKFYTALYRVYSGPTVYSDVNGEYRSMKQTAPFPAKDALPVRATDNVSNYKFKLNGEEAGYNTHYSGFSMWDTYRSQAQLIALVAPDEASEMMQSLVADAKQCGAIPHWVDGSDDTIPMQGDHGPNVVAGSYAFGARHFDIESMRTFMKQSAFKDDSACNNKLSVGRNDNMPVLPTYKKLGYVPANFPQSNPWHAGSATVEMVTSDRSIGAFLKALPTAASDKLEIDDLLTGAAGKVARASNWINLFDDTKKKLELKDFNGAWVASASKTFHESTEENYIWAFAHDWSALIEKLGGKSVAIDRLNKLFVFSSFTGTEPSGHQLNSGEGGTTFYIGNEPAFQTPWAYNWAGSPKHAQYVIPIIMNKTFTTNPGGIPGNDDMGATSTWYVLAALGLYPVIPSEAGFAVSTPQFSGINLWLGNGRKLRIETDKQALLDDTRYIEQMKLDDAVYSGTWLPLEKIAKGSKLSFTLSKLTTEWGAAPELTPPSGPNADYSKATAKPLPGPQIIQ